ncbi:MAG: response regulator, partial [Sphaerochaetaceae bacterium]|nr:response regulator [Sphaerochaetaceae bacterium]
MEDEGYEVLLAADGNEAWKLLVSSNIDLVVSDLRMPGLS